MRPIYVYHLIYSSWEETYTDSIWPTRIHAEGYWNMMYGKSPRYYIHQVKVV